MTSTTSPSGRRVGLLLVIGFWLAVWELAARLIAQELLLATPVAVVGALAGLIGTGEFWAAVGHSSARIIAGFLLATAAGVVLAAASGASRLVRDLLAPLFLVARNVPVVSFIVLVLMWTGSGTLSLVISFLIVLPVTYVNVLEGIDRTDRQLLEMARVFRIPLLVRVRAIDLPAVMPFFVAGSRVGLGLCWKSGVAAEVIGLPEGSIGERLYQAKVFLGTAEVFAWTIVVVAVSFAFERFFLAIVGLMQRRLTALGARA